MSSYASPITKSLDSLKHPDWSDGDTHQRVYRIAFSVAIKQEIPWEEAEDVAASTRLEAFRKTINEGGPLYSRWIGRVAHNKALDFQRSKYARDRDISLEAVLASAEEDGFESLVLTPEKDNPMNQAIEAAQMEYLHKCIAKLPDVFRHAILLTYFPELLPEEERNADNINPDTFRGRVRRGILRLQKQMLPFAD